MRKKLLMCAIMIALKIGNFQNLGVPMDSIGTLLEHLLEHPQTIGITIFFIILFQCSNKNRVYIEFSFRNNRENSGTLEQQSRKALWQKG